METNKRNQRAACVHAYLSGQWSMTELCERFGVSRPTGYLWINRYDPDDPESLLDHSCAPKTHGHQTDPAIVARILAARATYGWGAKKLLRVLQRHDPEVRWPARSTINDILNRHGLLKKRRRRRKWNHSGRNRCVPRLCLRYASETRSNPKDCDQPRGSAADNGPSQPDMAGGLQRAVQDPRWNLLLSTHRYRPLQPKASGM